MSQSHSDEDAFASDSFLDVLANMVGILIILVVIAGVRVERGPEKPSAHKPPPPSAETEASPEPEIAAAPEPEATNPPPELDRELRALKSETAALRTQRTASREDFQKLRTEYDAAREAAAAAERAAAEKQQELEARRAGVARLQQSLGDRKQVLTALLAEFEETRNSRPPALQIKHRLAPISQEVQGEEIHFRLSGNRVSVIPLPQLVERVKFQLERQKEWLSRHARQEGMVGPVDGYTLRYVVERQQLSALEERKLGYGAFRVGVSKWELVPDKDLPAETAEQALRRGSRFAIALQAAPEGASLTYWVYPDSFGLFRTLQEAAHAEGFIVAGRPLPEGALIEGSPHGSRSAGQ